MGAIGVILFMGFIFYLLMNNSDEHPAKRRIIYAESRFNR